MSRKPRPSVYTAAEQAFISAHLRDMTIKAIARALSKTPKSLHVYLRSRGIRLIDNPSLYDVPPQRFSQPSTPEAAYLLGFIWADGHINPHTHTVIVDCVKDDMDVLEPVFDRTGEWNKHAMHRAGKRPSRLFSTVNEALCDFLFAHGYREKSQRSPDTILQVIPVALRPLFWRGYFDGDGCISRALQVSIAGSFDQSWTAWEQLLLSLNARYSIQRRILGENSRGSTISLYSQTCRLKLLDYLYASFATDKIGLPRKHEAYQRLKAHSAKRPLSKTGFLGVHPHGPRFYAKIATESKKAKIQTYIGFYDTALEAARAFDKRALELRGPTTRLNFPLTDYVNPKGESSISLQAPRLSDTASPVNVG